MPYLQKLEILACPKLKSLPDFLFKTSLQEFEVKGSPFLHERYQRGTGEDWAKISHIPNIKINYIEVQRDGQEVIQQGNFFYIFSVSSFYFVQKIIINQLIFLFSAKISHWEIITSNVGSWIYQILNNLIRLFHLRFNVYVDLAHFLHFRIEKKSLTKNSMSDDEEEG